MNKEIKEELGRELETLILRIIESGDTVRIVELDDITEWIDQKLQQQYLLGAKDLWEAVKIEECSDGYYPNYVRGHNEVITAINTKAQQFIDSLEGKEDDIGN